MSNFEQWYKQEIGSENKPEYEAAKWAWEYQQKKLDCCREENKAHLEKINDLQSRVNGAYWAFQEQEKVNLRFKDSLKVEVAYLRIEREKLLHRISKLEAMADRVFIEGL